MFIGGAHVNARGLAECRMPGSLFAINIIKQEYEVGGNYSRDPIRCAQLWVRLILTLPGETDCGHILYLKSVYTNIMKVSRPSLRRTIYISLTRTRVPVRRLRYSTRVVVTNE